MAKLSHKQRKLLKAEARRLAAKQLSRAINPQSTDRPTEHPPNSESSGNTASQGDNQPLRAHVEHLVILVCDGIGIGLFGVLANMFFGMGHKILGLWFSYISAVMGVLLIAFPVTWYWPRFKLIVRNVSTTMIVILLICCVVWTCLEWEHSAISERPKIWQPPELPKECKIAYLHFYGETRRINLDDIKNGKPFSPLTNGYGFSKEMAAHAAQLAPLVILTNNRLWINMPVRTVQTSMTYSPNDLVEAQPEGFDVNYNANAIELVTRLEVPVFQAIYERPNMITVNCAFILSKTNSEQYGVFATFGTNRMMKLGSRYEMTQVQNRLKKYAIFRYPAWKYPGVLADPIRAPAKSEYELLPLGVVSNVVQALKAATRQRPSPGVLVYAVNPDESAFAFSEQLKKAFWDGGCVLVVGAPPQDIQEIPGVSCVMYGDAASNENILRALHAILDSTRSQHLVTIMPGKYPNPLQPVPSPFPLDLDNPKITFSEFQNAMDKIAEQSFKDSVILIMVRRK